MNFFPGKFLGCWFGILVVLGENLQGDYYLPRSLVIEAVTLMLRLYPKPTWKKIYHSLLGK